MSERVAVITGGTGGLGRAVTRAFLARGDAAVVSFIVPAEAEDLERSQVAHEAERLTLVRADVTEESGMADVVEAAFSRHGRIDFLVALVGGWSGGLSIWETDLVRWDRMIELNLRSAFLAVRAVAPVMMEAGYGRMVLVSSRAALTFPEGQAAYSVAKAGVITLVQAAAGELRDHGVTINCVLPSVLDTAGNRQAMPNSDPSKWVKPDELAAVIAFLASDTAGPMSGGAIPVYGRA